MTECTRRCEDCSIRLTDDQVCGMPARVLCVDCFDYRADGNDPTYTSGYYEY